MEAFKEEDYKGYKISIYQDTDPLDPRTNNDNLGHMVCFHKRYSLGDKHEIDHNDFEGWDEMEAYITKELGATLIYPLYLYDHSGLRMKIGSFYGLLPQGHAEFDSGMVGFIYCTSEDIRKWWGVKKVTKAVKKKAESYLQGEVTLYDQYLVGDVWGVRITKDEEEVESFWGIYGSDEAMNEAKCFVDVEVKENYPLLSGEDMEKFKVKETVNG